MKKAVVAALLLATTAQAKDLTPKQVKEVREMQRQRASVMAEGDKSMDSLVATVAKKFGAPTAKCFRERRSAPLHTPSCYVFIQEADPRAALMWLKECLDEEKAFFGARGSDQDAVMRHLRACGADL